MRVSVALVAIAIVAAGSPSAWAAEDARAAARRKLLDGARHLDAGKSAEALAAFEAAYALVPSPKIHYNFGLAYKAMHRNADALAAFERFLAEAADAPAATKEAAAQLRGELLSKVGTLTVSCDVAGATVTVDGRSIGETPVGAVYLDPGPHTVRVEKSGIDRPHAERVFATAGGTVVVAVRLGAAATAAAPKAEPPAEPTQLAAAPAENITVTPSFWSWQRSTAIGGATVAAAALAFGAYQQLRASDLYGQFNDRLAEGTTTRECGKKLPSDGSPECASLLQRGDAAQRRAIVGFAAGAAIAAGAAALFFSTPSSDVPTAAFNCSPELRSRGIACAIVF